jgi:hypothetical protein
MRLAMLFSLFLLMQNGAKGDEPDCFVQGECLSSAIVNQFEVPSIAECLSACQNSIGCKFFNYYAVGQLNACDALANCEQFSQDTCVNCNVGRRDCNREWFSP